MCGISGFYSWGAAANYWQPSELRLLTSALAHRGPDGEGFWTSEDGRVGLGHRRLAIIDIGDGGGQPMVDEESGSIITFNGEIYNYQELRSRLESRGHRFRSKSDTEVLIRTYVEYGEKCVDHLRGMYAFAIWDPRQQRLFAARDPFGVKPFYWHLQDGTFSFASEVRALASLPRIEKRIEVAAEVGFFLLGSVPEPWTIFKDIFSLEPGTSLLVDAAGAKSPQKFANVTSEIGRQLLEPTALNAEQVASLIKDSVQHHLVADVPVGVFLSAGIDSTLVASSLPHRSDSCALTLGFEEFAGTTADETPGAMATAKILGLRHNVEIISRGDFEALSEEFHAAMDQPTIDGLNVFLVSRMLAKNGLKVALSGIGGDELFAGYPSFHQVPRLSGVLSALGPISNFGRPLRQVLAPVLSNFTSSKFASVLEFGTSLEGAYLLRRALFMPWEIERSIGRERLRAGFEKLDPIGRMRRDIQGLGGKAAVAALEIQWYLRHQLLRDADWASMANSIELRVPFLDWPLFTAVAGAYENGLAPSRNLVLETIAPILPREITRRSKTGFSVPVREWLAASGTAATPSDRGLRGWSEIVYTDYLARWNLRRDAIGVANAGSG